MPASPAIRTSPGRELRAENHKRQHSLESGIIRREKEDDLALFNEVQNKETENFLLQSNDNFDDIFQTPLFPTLDDEAPPVDLAQRGRPRSQPVSISRSPTMEKGHRSGRGSPSPQRLSPSPRSGGSTLQSRGKPFSVTHSSPPPAMRHISPSRGQSPPPSQPTPPRRISTGSAGTTTPSRVRGTSPVKTSRGNSASPKIKAWQSSIPGFSSEAPPNLRTSLADRPASYVRGSSPASRNGRKSMSPTASRSVSSSQSHDRDLFSYHSKGSVASSGDDDLDSLQSIPASSSGKSAPRGISVYPSNSAVSFSKKPTKSLSSSAPKRSFDLVRQMDRKGPQNMFRPLLSSVPSSTFHVGNASSRHYSLTSINSSITTSSNASSDQATTGAHDTEESGQNEEDSTSDCVKGHFPYVDDELFVMEQADDLNEDIENRIVDDSLDNQHGEINGPPDMVICSKCGLVFRSAEVVIEGELQFCLQCKSLEVNSTITNPLEIVMVDQNNTGDHVQILEHGSATIVESLQVTCAGETGKNHLDKIANESQNSYTDSSQNFSVTLTDEEELTFAAQQVIKQLMDDDTGYQQLQHGGVNSNSQVDVSKSAGISLLLKKSSSVKGLIVQSRSFTASNTSYDDFSYARDSVNSMKSSIEHSSASVSSSVDLGSSRQTEIRIHRQSSGQKSDMENYRYEIPAMHKRSVSSMSGASGHMFHVQSVATSCHEGSFEEFGEETCVDPHDTNIENDIIFNSQETASHENGENLTNSSSNSQASMQEEDAAPSSCADRMDFAEVPNPSSLVAISEVEIENADVVSADSHSDVYSTDSKSCTDELRHDEAIITATVEEFDISQPAHHVLEESRIMLEDTGETKTRSLTLEEATDAILFCSSIVHNLAYEAANIAIDNETSSMEVLRPAVTFVGKPDSERRDNTRSRTVRKRTSKSQKARQKRLEMDTKPPSCNGETDENFSPRIFEAPNSAADSMKPPKLESKCNCIIM
ncbi:hypothetical protein DH2020_049687 [Rehmannia glutinosa]|uniref:Uncharacterized protein n=1 Tax=Rehmannia glutinosa TaxID=99300 RepID=A0ABR0U2T0_REHGL